MATWKINLVKLYTREEIAARMIPPRLIKMFLYYVNLKSY